ncbi:MAG: class I SAM-dependent methyltransferase [Patescibacteria group bacterium]
MKLYSRKNIAKQWILSQIESLAGDGYLDVCDLACGYGSAWPEFLKDHLSIKYFGIDSDNKEIAKAKRAFEGILNANVMVADAQLFRDKTGSFDVVTAFSALEYVVDLSAFMETVLSLLKSGGKAFLNYDSGHFRSSNPKERVMVPISQWLAKLGYEGSYMKEVRDEEIKKIAESKGGSVEQLLKFNGRGIKNLAGSKASDEAIREWHDFELKMNDLTSPEILDPIFWLTVIVVTKT